MTYKSYLYNKSYFTFGTWIGILSAIFVISGIIGFIYESVFYWANSGFMIFFWRPGTFGPWIDIWCAGGLIMFAALYRLRRKPWLVFLFSTVGGTLIELLVGVSLYYFFDGARAWNYNLEILNIGNLGGFICLRSIIVFAVAGLLLIYVVVPLTFKVAYNMPSFIFKTIYYIIGALCLCDIIYNDILCVLMPNLTSAYELYSSLGVRFMSF